MNTFLLQQLRDGTPPEIDHRRWVTHRIVSLTAAVVWLTTVPADLGGQSARTSAIRGRAISAETGAPVSGAEVSAVGLDLRAVTGSDGVFVLRNLPAGNVELLIRRIGFEPVFLSVEGLAAGDEVSIKEDLRLIRRASQLEELVVYGGRLARFYRRMADGKAIFMTREEIDGIRSRLFTWSDITRDARFRRAGLFPGRRNGVLLLVDGIRDHPFESTLLPDDIVGVELYRYGLSVPTEFLSEVREHAGMVLIVWTTRALPDIESPLPPGAIVGQILSKATPSQESAPVSNARITLDGQAIGTTTDGSGRFMLSRLTPDTYVLVVTAPGFKPLRISVTVTGGQVRTLDSTHLERAQ